VDGIELAICGICRVELKCDQAIGEAGAEVELTKQPIAVDRGSRVGLVAAVEVEILRELPGGLVEDVERAIQVVDEESIRADARLLGHEVDAGDIGRRRGVVARAVQVASERSGGVVLNFKRELRVGLLDTRGANRDCRRNGGNEPPTPPWRQNCHVRAISIVTVMS
jgi:hypothetical protein